jgi:hypothetical protein
MTAAIGLVKAAFDPLHPAANKERGVVAFGNDGAIHDERKAKLLEAALD